MSTPPSSAPLGPPPSDPPAAPAPAAPAKGKLGPRQTKLLTVSGLESFRHAAPTPTVPQPKPAAAPPPAGPAKPSAASLPPSPIAAEPEDVPASGKDEKKERKVEKKGSRIARTIFGGKGEKLKKEAEVHAAPTQAPQPVAPRVSAEDLKSKIQDLLDSTQNHENIAEYNNALAKLDQVKRDNKGKDIVTAAKERVKGAEKNSKDAFVAQRELFARLNVQNFGEAEKILLGEIKQILHEMLKNPGGMTAAISTIASVRIPSEGFLRMILDLEPKDLKELIIQLAKEEAKSELPFRTDSLFTKLLRERSFQELRPHLAPLIQQATQAATAGQSPENGTIALLTSLRDTLRNHPLSPDLQDLYRQIYSGRLLATNAERSEVILVSLFAIRVLNPLVMEGNETNVSVIKLSKQLQVAASIEDNLQDPRTGPILHEIFSLLTGVQSK